MGNVVNKFRKKIADQYSMHENMIQPSIISIYDYGTFSDGVFIKHGNLMKDYKLEEEVKFSTMLKGSVLVGIYLARIRGRLSSQYI